MTIASTPSSLGLELLAWGTVEVAADQWPAWRRRPGSAAPDNFPPAALKQADEQTIAGLGAVYQALQNQGNRIHDLSRWGVIGCPRFQGRHAIAESLTRYTSEGAWGMSPHFIPQRSLHSLSGVVSLQLGLRGPNYGVDASRDPGAGLLAACALLQQQELPGVWLIEAGFFPELPPDPAGTGKIPPGAVCQAVALALTGTPRPGTGLVLHIEAGAASGSLQALREVVTPPKEKCWSLGCGLRVRAEQSVPAWRS